MYSSLSVAFIYLIISSTFFNCLHYVVGDDGGSNRNKNNNESNSFSNKAVGRSNRIGLHIDITRKRSIHLNGAEIDEYSLAHHLQDHEKELLFGSSKKLPRELKLVHLNHLTDAADASKPQMPPRRKRAAAAADSIQEATLENSTEWQNDNSHQQQTEQLNHEVSVRIIDKDETVSLKLKPAPKLIDDAFIFLRRYANFTQFIEDSHKLAENFQHCFYSNENAALDLCDDENVRGVFQHNSADFIIQPLPERFGKSTHVILETEKFQPTFDRLFGGNNQNERTFDENMRFEPDMDDFNDLREIKSNNMMNNSINTNVENNVDDDDDNNDDNHDDDDDDDGDDDDDDDVGNITSNLNLLYKTRFHQNNNAHNHYHHHNHHHHHHSHRHHQQQQQQLQKQRKKGTPLKGQQHQSQKKLHHQRESSQQYKQNNQYYHQNHRRHRRYISKSGGQQRPIPPVLHIETAIFVDRDLVHHMSKNFPKNTESQLMRFVLTIISGVQLLYHHPTLGRRVNFVLKRLEILYNDPTDLGRSSDIDIYLNNFCMWQRKANPTPDSDPLHYDHAVILTGLDLYVVGKNGKMISQVVGLAPVAGMCTLTSSCTINEGKHFESVFVVAHEIGHNLGMRHDTRDTGCDPDSHIMSPTLGTGKITWSKCSRTYLDAFLETPLAECLFDRSPSDSSLDHSAEGLLPGERFNADKQCMLKYGRDSVRARNQLLPDICRDLHCQRERYTWTSHPALDGTECGSNMWCRSGSCVSRPPQRERNEIPREPMGAIKSNYDKASFNEINKREHLHHEYNHVKPQTWGEWSEKSACDSGCLYGPSNALSEGSTGLHTYARKCLDRGRCLGRDKKYESCIAKHCFNVKKTTIEEFATNVCERVGKFDADLTGKGVQIVGDIEESCKILCTTKSNTTKSRNWTFPDGTSCRSKHYNYDATAYCIAGRCEKFSCDSSNSNYYKINPKFCQSNTAATQSEAQSQAQAQSQSLTADRYSANYNSLHPTSSGRSENDRDYYNRNQNRFYGPTTVRNKYENEVAVRNIHSQQQTHDQYKQKSDTYGNWNKYNYRLNDQYPLAANQPVAASLRAVPPKIESEWIVKSGCHSSCMAKSKGVQVVASRRTGTKNIQLCSHVIKPCDHLLTATEYADNTCARYKLKVRGLSGYGAQIAASVDNPDRSCRVGCQDEFIKYRFYLVNGKYGHFPLGTKCSNTEERYCVNGKCLEFGANNIPLQQSHISLAHYRNRRSINENRKETETKAEVESESEADADADAESSYNSRSKRSFLYYAPVNITETITQDFINSIVNSIIDNDRKPTIDEHHTADHIEFMSPIHMSMDELSIK